MPGKRSHVRQKGATNVAHDPDGRDLVTMKFVDVLVVEDHRSEAFVNLRTPLASYL